MKFKKVLLFVCAILLASCVDQIDELYKAFYVDVDGDGIEDIYLQVQPVVVIIAGEYDIPVDINGNLDIFLQGVGDGSFNAPTTWEGGSVNVGGNLPLDILKLYVKADGSTQYVIQAADSSYNTVVMSFAATAVPAMLEQFEGSELLGTDLSSASSTLSASDVNGDGRDEIIVTDKITGATTTIYANENGVFDNMDDEDKPIAKKINETWRGYVSALKSKNAASATSYFHTSVGQRYEESLSLIEDKLENIALSLTNFTVVEIGEEYALFAVNRTISGVKKIYFVEFAPDSDDEWLILSM